MDDALISLGRFGSCLVPKFPVRASTAETPLLPPLMPPATIMQEILSESKKNLSNTES